VQQNTLSAANHNAKINQAHIFPEHPQIKTKNKEKIM
jgi:hypothetical protein